MSERTADLSRRHQVTDSKDGVVHITGGKWTTYRQMAEDTVDALKAYFPQLGASKTRKLRLHGYGAWRPTTRLETHLYQRYGVDAREVLALIRDEPELGNAIIKNQPYVGAEFIYGAIQEMSTSLIDLLIRRTRAHLLDARSTFAAAGSIADLVGPVLGWSIQRRDQEVLDYETLVIRELSAAGLSL